MQTAPQILPFLLSAWRFFLWLQEPCLLRVPQPCEPTAVHIALSPLSRNSLPFVCDYQVVGQAQEFLSWEAGGRDQRKEGLLDQTSTGSHSSRTGGDSRDAQGSFKDDYCQGGHTLGSAIRKHRGGDTWSLCGWKDGYKIMFWSKDLPVPELTLTMLLAMTAICTLLRPRLPTPPLRGPGGPASQEQTETFSLTMLALLSKKPPGRPLRPKAVIVPSLSTTNYW